MIKLVFEQGSGGFKTITAHGSTNTFPSSTRPTLSTMAGHYDIWVGVYSATKAKLLWNIGGADFS